MGKNSASWGRFYSVLTFMIKSSPAAKGFMSQILQQARVFRSNQTENTHDNLPEKRREENVMRFPQSNFMHVLTSPHPPEIYKVSEGFSVTKNCKSKKGENKK